MPNNKSRTKVGILVINLQSMHHIAIIVSDYEKSKHFYVELLGFEIVRENYRPQREDYKLDLKFGDSELEIFGIKNAPKRPSPEACGLRHLAFKVDCIEDVIRELNEKGIETEPVRFDEFTESKMTFFKDPDGLPLELHE
jgi:glyoxylase I family protein